MPWSIKKRDGRFCVIKDDDGSVEGCHDSRDRARRQLAALYASEAKETLMNQVTINIGSDVPLVEDTADKAVWSAAMINDLPDSSFLYIEPGGEKDDENKTTPRSLRHFPYKDAGGKVDLPHLRNAISRAPQANLPADVKQRVQERARRILAEQTKEDDGWFDSLVARVKEALGIREETRPPDSGLMLWKEADGQYRWVARYSNNFRDQDNPPEIIAARSHRRFVELVDKGLVPKPELWLWHVKDWKWGEANWVAWDDAGFALAGGVVDKGKEPLAEALAALSPDALRVSHGMPKDSIQRDPDDETIIIEHLTREISPLPAFAAANQMTGFIMSKEATMAIPDEKLQELRTEWNLSDEILGTLQAANAAEAEEGKQAGIEQKEKSDPETEEASTEKTVEVAEPEAEDASTEKTVEVDAEPAVEVAPEAEAEPETAPEPQAITRDEMQAALEAIGQAITALSGQVKEIEAKMTEVKEEKSVKEALTLSEIFERAIGHQDARVDGRTTEAKDRPAERREKKSDVINSGNPLADSVITDIVSGVWRQDLPQ